MGRNSSTGITWQHLKDAIPFGTLLVTIVLAWGSMSTQLALLNAKTDTILDKHDTSLSRINEIDKEQVAQGKDIAAIKQVISDAQARGVLTSAVQKSPSIVSLASRSGEVTNFYLTSSNAGTSAEIKKADPQPEPKLGPTPTPQTQEENSGVRTIPSVLESILKPIL